MDNFTKNLGNLEKIKYIKIMTEKEFITYCKALLDSEWEKLRIDSIKDGADRELIGTLKLIDDALRKVDETVKKKTEKREPGPSFDPNKVIGPGTHNPDYLSPPWEVTCTNGNPVKQSITNTKQQLND